MTEEDIQNKNKILVMFQKDKFTLLYCSTLSEDILNMMIAMLKDITKATEWLEVTKQNRFLQQRWFPNIPWAVSDG